MHKHPNPAENRIDRRPRRAARLIGALLCAALLLLVSTAGYAASDENASGDSQTIAMIGAGNVGQELGRMWAAAGYQVIFATRHPDELGDVVDKAGHGARAAAVGKAIQQADIVMLAVPYKAEPSIAKQHANALQGKVLIDADNAFASRDGAIVAKAEKVGEAVYSARLFKGTRFVRAFNLVGASQYPPADQLDSADFNVPYTTNDPSTRELAEKLIRATGGTPVYKGALKNAPEYSS